MTSRKKHCLILLVAVFTLLLATTIVAAQDVDNQQTIEDTNGLSTPANYDVDKVVQSDSINSNSIKESEADVKNNKTEYQATNIEKTNKTTLKQADDNSDERYSVMVYKNGAGWTGYNHPYTMNDSTLVFSLNGTSRNTTTNEYPFGYSPSIPPGVYKKPVLTEDYQYIHPI
ncbi:MAG: hypothetical protein J6S29_00695, partial [Methanosphaera sp.]|nr:hypothetical protein [Methanosphaera sp.]